MSEPETAIFLELNLWDDVDNFDKEQESDSRREGRRTLRLEQQFTQSDSGSVVWDCGRVLFDFFKRHQHDFRGKFVLAKRWFVISCFFDSQHFLIERSSHPQIRTVHVYSSIRYTVI